MTYVNVNGSVSMTSPPERCRAGDLHHQRALAAEFDITPRAIRDYEDMGLLDPARDGRNWRLLGARPHPAEADAGGKRWA